MFFIKEFVLVKHVLIPQTVQQVMEIQYVIPPKYANVQQLLTTNTTVRSVQKVSV